MRERERENLLVEEFDRNLETFFRVDRVTPQRGRPVPPY